MAGRKVTLLDLDDGVLSLLAAATLSAPAVVAFAVTCRRARALVAHDGMRHMWYGLILRDFGEAAASARAAVADPRAAYAAAAAEEATSRRLRLVMEHMSLSIDVAHESRELASIQDKLRAANRARKHAVARADAARRGDATFEAATMAVGLNMVATAAAVPTAAAVAAAAADVADRNLAVATLLAQATAQRERLEEAEAKMAALSAILDRSSGGREG